MANRSQSGETSPPGRRFQGKTVAITGPSLHGIGGSIAIRMAEEGAALVLLGLEEPSALLEQLATLREPVDQFFAEVMVMTDNPALRNNRLAILQRLRDLFMNVADISQLAVTK